MEFELSKYQQDIIDYVKFNKGNLLIDAKAGSGKTSTLIIIANELLKSDKHCMFLSFNNSIVNELKLKIPEMASSIKTVHSLGLTFIRSYCYKKHNTNYEIVDMEIAKKKVRELCKQYYEKYYQKDMVEYLKETMSEQEIKDVNAGCITDFVQLVNFARLYCLSDFSDEKQVGYLARRFCKTLPLYDEIIPNVSDLVSAVLHKIIEMFEQPEIGPDGKYQYVIDFTDMIFFPVWYQMQVPYSLRNSLDTILVDECIPETHYVETEYGKMKFRELKRKIDKGEKLKVKTFNENSEQFEFKNVISVTDKGIKPIYEITTNGLNKIQATDNHPFMTQNGWKQLKDLEIGKDYLYLDKPSNQKTKYIPNDDQLQLILGSALGDGSLQKVSNNNYEFRIKFTHSDKQINYLKFKQKILNCKEPYIIKSGYTQQDNIYTTNSNVFLLPYSSKIDFINHLDLRGLAILYMDDGSKLSKYDYSGTRISCNSFSLEETNALIDKLKEFGINSTNVPRKRNNKIYNELYIDSNNSKIFFKKIAPYMHFDCYYKNPLSTGEYNWNSKWKSFGGNIVKSIQYVGEQKVLDMEVEDNHNFLISKFHQKNGSSILVHNCQDLSQLQQLFIRRLYTGFNRFIFVGDRNQSIYGFNGADTKAIDRIKDNFYPKELPLSICYRCPEKIVRLAQDNVPSIEWNKERVDKGILDTLTYREMKSKIGPGDMIIGRGNRDLLKIYKDFTLNDKREVKLKNKEMVNSISRDINQCIRDYLQLYAKNQNIDRVANEYMDKFMEANDIKKYSNLYNTELNNFIKKYVKEHKEELAKKEIMKANHTLEYLDKCMEEYKVDGAYNYDEDNPLTEYFDIISEFIEYYKSKHSSILVRDFTDYMDDFLNASLNKYNVPIISSVHSMKGGEADTVYIFDYPRFPYMWKDMNKEDEQQEANLQYVAITRAKKNLYLILCDPNKAKDDKQRERIEENNNNCIAKVAHINRLVDDLRASDYGM